MHSFLGVAGAYLLMIAASLALDKLMAHCIGGRR